MFPKAIVNRGVETVVQQKVMMRRDRKAAAAAITSEDNVLTSEVVGGISFNFLKFESRDNRPLLQTSRRYCHVGGATEMWRTNKRWNNDARPQRVHYAKGRFSYANRSAVNPQVSQGPGPRLPSNPLPPFQRRFQQKLSHNDDRKADKGKEVEDLANLAFVKDEEYRRCYMAWHYDEFLGDDENRNLANTFRMKILTDKTPYYKDRRPAIRCEPDDWVEDEEWEDYDAFEAHQESLNARALKQLEWKDFTDVEYDQAMETIGNSFRELTAQGLQHTYPHGESPMTSVQAALQATRNLAGSAAPPTSPVPEYYQSALDFDVTDDGPVQEHVPLRLEPEKLGFFATLRNLPAVTTETLETLTRAGTRVEQLAENANDSLTNLHQHITKYFEGLSKTFKGVIDFGCLSGDIFNLFYDAYHYHSYSLPVLMLKVGRSCLGIFRTIFPTQSNGGLQSQGGEYDLFAMFFNNRHLLSVAKTMNAFHQLRNGFSSVREFAGWVFGSLPRGIQDLLAYFLPAEEQWKRDVQAFGERLIDANAAMEKSEEVSLDEAEWLRSEAVRFSKLFYVANNKTAALARSIATSRKQVLMIVMYAHAYRKHNTPRQCPFSVVFHGGSRVGKSVYITKFVKLMAALEEHAGHLSYTRRSGTDHWDAFFEDTFATIFDDWLQVTDYDDVSEFFALVTKQHFVVPMASLEDPLVGRKGTLNLCKMIVAATNLRNKQAVATKINAPDALFARIALRVDVKKVSDYDAKNYSHLRFRVFGHGTDDYVTEWMEHKDFMQYAVAAYDAHYSNQCAIDEEVDAEANELAELLRGRENRRRLVMQALVPEDAPPDYEAPSSEALPPYQTATDVPEHMDTVVIRQNGRYIMRDNRGVPMYFLSAQIHSSSDVILNFAWSFIKGAWIGMAISCALGMGVALVKTVEELERAPSAFEATL